MMRAAVIGLGKIGNLFDADPKRQGTWSHAGAYEKAEGVALVAGADPDLSAREAFLSRRAGTLVYADYRDLLERERPDIVSICTPPEMHSDMVLCAAAAGVRGVFCEKPLAASLADAHRIVETCHTRDVRLAVNHIRRWDREFLWPKALIEQGGIGTVQTVTGWYYGGALNLCTHMVDTIHMLTGGSAVAAGCGASRGAGKDPGVSGVLHFRSGLTARLACVDGDRDLWFEIDLAGTDGRLRILNNGSNLERHQWAPSDRYSGYRELVPVSCVNPLPPHDRFLDSVRDLVSCIEQRRKPACSGEDGYAAVAAVTALRESAAAGGARVAVVPPFLKEETS